MLSIAVEECPALQSTKSLLYVHELLVFDVRKYPRLLLESLAICEGLDVVKAATHECILVVGGEVIGEDSYQIQCSPMSHRVNKLLS